MIDSLDNRNDIITDLLIEAFDLGKLMEEYEAHYQRGFEAGKASIGAEQLKTEFERGRESYRDELLAEIQKRNAPPAPKAPIAESIEEKPASETKSIAISKPEKNLGGRPNQSGRPDGLPRNLDMALEAIKELGGRAAAPQILAYVRKKWWAGFPTHWTANLYDFVKEKKLERDGINFVALDSKAPAAQDVLPKEPLKIPMPTVKPTAGPRPPAAAPASRRFDAACVGVGALPPQ